MSHSYSFRHGKSQSMSSSSSGGHQRVTYGSRSTSTGTPPPTPTIRVTSPVPDVVGMIDIWDPEVVEDEPPSASPKTYSFRYKEEKKHKQRKHHVENKTNFTDSGMQADPIELEASSGHPELTTLPAEGTGTYVIQLSDASPVEDDGLKTAGESEESSDCDEMSQISAVTQIPRSETQRTPEAVDEVETAEDPFITANQINNQPTPEEAAPAVEPAPSNSHHIWDEMQSPTDADKPIKRVQFSRSLSLVPGSSAAHQTASVESDQRAVRSGSGRRYSSMDSGAHSDTFPSMLTFVEHHQQFAVSKRKMLSPTPESALENAQSPQQEGEPIAATNVEEELLSKDCQQQSGDTMAALSVTVEDVGEGTDHDPTCDLFDRLNALKNDEELMDLATGFVLQLLRSAQDEALRRGHVPSKIEQKAKLSLELQHVAVPKGRNNRKWYSRLRTLLLRTLTCTCVPTHPNIQSPLSN
ncbi:uncharacterized protein LOC130695052 [Daphnia carinata]|uniref:uncharacterized protein LOC130695052 n=1 Tax=Daphnia carinata TaxID=120202 RepID=UPI00257D0C79|nr:uncharacterized protein LOC130695052 [Daphnia carinata]